MPWRRNRPGWLIRRYGRRGVFLLMFGMIYLVVGMNILLIPAPRFAAVAAVGAVLDSPLWGVMWVSGGALAVGFALARPRRVHDEIGFIGLLVPAFAWTIFHTVSLLSWAFTGGEHGSPRSLSGVAAWSFVWTVVLLISGWPDSEPVDTTHGESGT